MRRGFWVLALVLATVLITSVTTAQVLNRIAEYALKSGVRGFSCASWGGMPSSERAAYVLGIIALSDALEHASLDVSHSLTSADYRAIELTRSATDYTTMISSGCLAVPSSTPVLAVLFTLK